MLVRAVALPVLVSEAFFELVLAVLPALFLCLSLLSQEVILLQQGCNAGPGIFIPQ